MLAELLPKRLRVAELNHPGSKIVPGDLRVTWPTVVEHYFNSCGDSEPWLLSACPPCQGMSSANSMRGKGDDIVAGASDPRNLLVLPIFEVANRLLPRAIVVENVAAFLTRQVPHPETGDGVSAASLLIELLQDRYVVYPFLCDLAHFGVPQRRRRAFLTFIRRDILGLKSLIEQRRAPYPRPTHDPNQGGAEPITVGSCLSQLKLPMLDAGAKATAQCHEPLHSVPVWSSHHHKMVKAIPPGSGKSAWANELCATCGSIEVDDSEANCPRCQGPLLRPVVPRTDGRYRLVKGFRASSYRRMDPNRPAPTVTTANGTIGSATTIHPWENRVLSALECSELQTIPRSFRWTNDDAWALELHVVRRMIGEVVPPKFTEMHGHAIRGVLENNWRLAPISNYDIRCQRATEKINLEIPLKSERDAAIERSLQLAGHQA